MQHAIISSIVFSIKYLLLTSVFHILIVLSYEPDTVISPALATDTALTPFICPVIE